MNWVQSDVRELLLKFSRIVLLQFCFKKESFSAMKTKLIRVECYDSYGLEMDEANKAKCENLVMEI